MYQLRWEVIDETNKEIEVLLDVYPIANFDTEQLAINVWYYLSTHGAKCPSSIGIQNAKLRIVEVL